MKITKDQLLVEIARRAPWYQCISFPEYGVSTTDDPRNAMLDAAWDNKIGDISLEEAARLRPTPKWRSISEVVPDVRGLDVLEIGCNCGFFSLTFAQKGARSIVGLDVAPKWLDNANWARDVLGLNNVSFANCDFMRYAGSAGQTTGLLSVNDQSVPLPNGLFDMVFMSTVLDHLFFPLFSIYKMLRISRRWVIIDVPSAPGIAPEESLARLSVPPDNSHHGFTFSQSFLTQYISRLGIPPEAIQVFPYNDARNLCYVIDVTKMRGQLIGC